MANSKSAAKAARVTQRRTIINRRVTSALKTYVKSARDAIQSGEIDVAQKSTRLAVAELDKAGTRGYIHRNEASRTKSRLTRQLNGLMASAIIAKPEKAKAKTSKARASAATKKSGKAKPKAKIPAPRASVAKPKAKKPAPRASVAKPKVKKSVSRASATASKTKDAEPESEDSEANA